MPNYCSHGRASCPYVLTGSNSALGRAHRALAFSPAADVTMASLAEHQAEGPTCPQFPQLCPQGSEKQYEQHFLDGSHSQVLQLEFLGCCPI